MKKRIVAAGALALIMAASAYALPTDSVPLAGTAVETTAAHLEPQPAAPAPATGTGYAEVSLGGAMSQLNNGFYAMTDDAGYYNIASNAPAISTDSYDAAVGMTYFWSLKSWLWCGAGFTFIYPFVQMLNGATTIGGVLASGVGPSGQNQPSNWFTAPTIFSFNAPFRIALTPDVLITLTPSLLGAVIYDNSLKVTYFGIGASASLGLTWYFSKSFGTSASAGYRYIYSVSDTYGAPLVSDIMHNTYANNGLFGMAGLVFRF